MAVQDQRGNNAHISPASWEEAIRKAASGGPTGRAPSEQGFPGVSGATAGPTMSDDPFAHRRGGYTGVTDTQRLEMQEKIKKEAQERLDVRFATPPPPTPPARALLRLLGLVGLRAEQA